VGEVGERGKEAAMRLLEELIHTGQNRTATVRESVPF
jgi:hypothetical protein